MPQVYVRNSGVWAEPKEIFVRANGGWNTVREVYVNSNGTWLRTYPLHGSQSFTSGSGTFTVPAGIYTLTVSYPTARSGIQSQTLSVTPGDNISYNIAGFGGASTFGSVTAPIFDTPVFYVSLSVDSYIQMIISCATPDGVPYSGSGGYPNPAGTGNTFSIAHEGDHGQLGKYISITPVSTTVCLNSLQTYVSAGSGRDGNWRTYIQPYASGDSILFGAYIQDQYYSEGGYSVTWNLQQQVPFTVSW